MDALAPKTEHLILAQPEGHIRTACLFDENENDSTQMAPFRFDVRLSPEPSSTNHKARELRGYGRTSRSPQEVWSSNFGGT